MVPRHWTVLLVPPDNGPTRTLRVSQRKGRALAGIAGAAGLLVTGAIIVLVTPWASPGNRLAVAENARLRTQLALLDTRLAALGDTLASLSASERQLRALAGLPADTAVAAFASSATALPLRTDVASLASLAPTPHLPKPFLDRLGFGRRPDVDGMIRRATDLSMSVHAVSDTLTRNFERLANTPSIMPTAGWLSSHFSQSRFHPVLHENRPHEGIDLSAPMGAPIVAPAAGRVKSVDHEPGYGNTLEIDHGNGIVTKYAHCSRIVVRVGDTVTRAQLIATVGNTGLSTGPHLHYEIHVDGKPVDPLKFALQLRATD